MRKRNLGIELAVIWLFLAAALAVRAYHLVGPLDEPSWRQADTAYMAARMAEESPPQLLHPKAPFRGRKDVKAAEYPIYPCVVSLVYKALGRESLAAARCVTIAFFLGSAWFLFAIAEFLFDRKTAWYVLVVFTMLPLGIFFSRAVHPDFSIVCFSHAFFYFGLRFYESKRAWAFVAATFAASCAFLMKAPYCFYFGLPIAMWVLSRRSGWTATNLLTLGGVFVIPLLLALWFNEHRIGLESGELESLLYPMKWTHDSSVGRFFGVLAQRFEADRWVFLFKRTVISVLTPCGAVAAAVGLVWGGLRRPRLGWWCLVAWLVGVVAYILLVFPMVTGPHSYYSIPLLAPSAVAIGLAMARWAGSRLPKTVSTLGVVTMLGCLAHGSMQGIQRGNSLYGTFFRYDWQRIEAGMVIGEQTRPEDLILSVTHGRSTGWSDPRILYVAHRRGWAIELKDLDEQALALYRSGGARYAALLLTPLYPPQDALYPQLARFPRHTHDLVDPQGEVVGCLLLFDLSENSALRTSGKLIEPAHS